MRREPPAVDFLHDDNYAICPVKGCGARAPELVSDEPDCDHEYPGRCAACDTIVGDRYSDLVWMGKKLGVEQWLCERCRGYCEACDGEGLITFDGVCGDCCRIVAADGAVLHEGKRPALELGWWPRSQRLVEQVGGKVLRWRRIKPPEPELRCDGCGVALPPPGDDVPELAPALCESCLTEDRIEMLRIAHGGDR
jgi:hypothetical protein